VLVAKVEPLTIDQKWMVAVVGQAWLVAESVLLDSVHTSLSAQNFVVAICTDYRIAQIALAPPPSTTPVAAAEREFSLFPLLA
jgi:hypothetical protein